MSTSDNCKDGASSKSSNDDVCELSDMLKDNSMMMVDKDKDDVSVCANCGKEGSDVNNICNKCKVVKYCNATCKKKHRHKHKRDCEEHVRIAAERAAELHDEELFKQPPPQYGDCPICFIQLPSLGTGRRYHECCGKVICSGCVYAPIYDSQGNKVDNKKCPFCRTPHHTSNEEMVKRTKKRVEAGDPIAIFNIGVYYRDGIRGFPQNHLKALELWHRAAELGYALAYASIGYAYDNGDGVERDMKKANYYYELAAIRGVVGARHNLGLNEANAGNMDRALKHFIIAVRGGYTEPLKGMKQLYSNGYAITKEDYTKALQSYQAYLVEIKSDQRDKAAAAHEGNRYY